MGTAFRQTADLYGILATAYVLIRLLSGERFAPVAAINHGGLAALWPALALFWLAAAQRDRGRLVLYALPALDLLLQQNYWRQEARPFTPDRAGFSLLTFNLQGRAVKSDRLIALMREQRADIVCLQELTASAASAVSCSFRDEYPFREVFTQGETIHGCAIYSRFPLRGAEYLAGEHGHWRVLVDGLRSDGEVAVYSVHPSPPGGFRNRRGFAPLYRSRELDVILARAERESVPVILAGDFNFTELSDDYRRMRQRFRDVFADAGTGFGLTHPDLGMLHPRLGGTWFGLTRLDYIFVSEGVEAVSIRVLPEACGSDHRPVIAKLAFPSGKG
jgi:endonuclease/exonuclease/phosphatase (EEP) superfamily protein YafD